MGEKVTNPPAGKPARWRGSDAALHAVQEAFDVQEAVFEAVRRAAFENNLSNSEQIRNILGLSRERQAKRARPRLTVTLTQDDYATLGERYGLPIENRLAIKEQVVQELIAFAAVHGQRVSDTSG
jgi:hypothetical protein